jgi:hypothetical protein
MRRACIAGFGLSRVCMLGRFHTDCIHAQGADGVPFPTLTTQHHMSALRGTCRSCHNKPDVAQDIVPPGAVLAVRLTISSVEPKVPNHEDTCILACHCPEA